MLLGSLFLMDLSAQSYDVKVFRAAFYRAAESGEAAQTFQIKMETYSDSSDAIVLGYKGAARFMLAHHGKSPLTKLEHFRAGKRLLRQAIASYPENIELRFIRYAVQTNAPLFLGNVENIREDQDLLLAALYANQVVDTDLEKRIVDFMLQSKYCNTKDKKALLVLKRTWRPGEQ